MPFEITISREFSAAHALRLYDGSLEPLHGHNWRIAVTVESAKLDAIGVVMDFHVLEAQVDAIVGPFHNANLNDRPEFAQLNPTTEHIAQLIGQRIGVLPAGVRLGRVEVWETSTCSAVYRP